MEIFENIINSYTNENITTNTILSVLLTVAILAIYEFIVYRKVSHRSFNSYWNAWNLGIF